MRRTPRAALRTGVDHRHAECLSAWWKNRGLLRKSPDHVSNQCPGYGTVVAKVDLVSTMGRRILPRDSIRGTSGCSDMGICNKSDAVATAGCRARFLRVSPATATRGLLSAVAVISGDRYECRISAMCLVNGPMFVIPSRRIAVPWIERDNLRDRLGKLGFGPSDRARSVARSASVRDAQVEEVEGATLDCIVFLGWSASETTTLRYATSDGMARAGLDYRATRGMLTLAPGQTEKPSS